MRKEYDQKRNFQSTFTFDFGDIGDYFRESFFNEDIFDAFSEIFNFGERRVKDLNIYYELTIKLEEAVRGTAKEIYVSRETICHNCRGTGAENGRLKICHVCKGSGKETRKTKAWPGIFFEELKSCRNCRGSGKIPEIICSHCQGKGKVIRQEKVKIEIPPKLSLERMKIPGLGHEDLNKRGDLIIDLRIIPQSPFQIIGNDLILDVIINIVDAILGKEIYIPYFGQEIRVQIPPGVNQQDTIRIKNYGLKNGDLIVRVNIETPKRLSKRARDLLEKLREELS
ncbi:MAG: hypothetical protein NZ822_02985 [Patescibacteria group bacterium]|nr:hypothetical protein [Patescibacteria group bacterium]